MEASIPFAAIDIITNKLADLDATDEVILGRDIMQALATVQCWLDEQPNVIAARQFKLKMQHSINTSGGD